MCHVNIAYTVPVIRKAKSTHTQKKGAIKHYSGHMTSHKNGDSNRAVHFGLETLTVDISLFHGYRIAFRYLPLVTRQSFVVSQLSVRYITVFNPPPPGAKPDNTRAPDIRTSSTSLAVCLSSRLSGTSVQALALAPLSFPVFRLPADKQ
jgi:hypothetical protein